jgi:hypothetical protein
MTPEEIEEKKRSRNLDSEHNNHMQQDQQLKKLLLLGAGESGAPLLRVAPVSAIDPCGCALFLLHSDCAYRSEAVTLLQTQFRLVVVCHFCPFCLFVSFHSPHTGKSTLFKQAIALYGAKPTHAEMMQFVPIICNNIIQNIKTLIKYSDELSPPCPVTGGNQQHKALIDEVRADATKLTPAQAAAVKALWADAGIQVCAREQCRCDEM